MSTAPAPVRLREKRRDEARPTDAVPLMCPRCGMQGSVHADLEQCVDALRSVLADLSGGPLRGRRVGA
jgi:hypothetical protein